MPTGMEVAVEPAIELADKLGVLEKVRLLLLPDHQIAKPQGGCHGNIIV